jgi:general secretion pathway protein G
MHKKGFTIVEIIIVITVIGILATIAIVSYNGAQVRARNATRLNDMKAVEELLETYFAQHREYPKTTNNPQSNWKAIDVYTDKNCPNGSSQADWVPGLADNLPQSDQSYAVGVDGAQGCYLYASNGSQYVLSAWNMISVPQNTTLYRRLGFREFQSSNSTQFYTCNSNTVGGATSGYNINQDYYKHSYTISNITDCDETPPPGA